MHSKKKYSIDDLYLLWLKNHSLREIEFMTGVPHSTIHQKLRRKYGKDCCNLKKASLLRSLITEYPDQANLFLDEPSLKEAETFYYTSRGEDSNTYYQAVISNINLIPQPEKQEIKPFLQPAIFIMWVHYLINLIKINYFGEGFAKLLTHSRKLSP